MLLISANTGIGSGRLFARSNNALPPPNEPVNPTALVNALRVLRGATPLANVTESDLLDERARELYDEGWRRNDLIRFGKWEGSWGIKTSTDVTRRLFPIPQNQIDTNPNLQQNPGY